MGILKRAIGSAASMGADLLVKDYERGQALAGHKELMSLEEGIKQRLQEAAHRFSMERDRFNQESESARQQRALDQQRAIEDQRLQHMQKVLELETQKAKDDSEHKRQQLDLVREQMRRGSIFPQTDANGQLFIIDKSSGKALPVLVDGNPFRIPMEGGKPDLTGVAKIFETLNMIPDQKTKDLLMGFVRNYILGTVRMDPTNADLIGKILGKEQKQPTSLNKAPSSGGATSEW